MSACAKASWAAGRSYDMQCSQSASLPQDLAVPQPADIQRSQPGTANCPTRQSFSDAAVSNEERGWSAPVSVCRSQSPQRGLGVATPARHQTAAHSSSVIHSARPLPDGEQTAQGEPQSPSQVVVAALRSADDCTSPVKSPERVDAAQRQGPRAGSQSPMRAFASLELPPTEELDEALQLQLLSPTLAGGVSTPMLHQVRRASCTHCQLRRHRIAEPQLQQTLCCKHSACSADPVPLGRCARST